MLPVACLAQPYLNMSWISFLPQRPSRYTDTPHRRIGGFSTVPGADKGMYLAHLLAIYGIAGLLGIDLVL